jgi:hypothetical protein
VVDSLRRGFSRLTADHVSSRPQSVALPASLGLLACTRALQKRLPNTAAAIAIGFSLGLRPMTIHGLHAEDFTLTQTDAFIRLRREKGNARQRADRVLRLPIRLDSISRGAVASQLRTHLASLMHGSKPSAAIPLPRFCSATTSTHQLHLAMLPGNCSGACSHPHLDSSLAYMKQTLLRICQVGLLCNCTTQKTNG